MTDLEHTLQQKKYKILLIGDSCIDEYYYGTCDRLNPEAPVPVLKITRSTVSQGMAANVKLNLESFGCDVDFMTGGKKSIKRRYIDDRSKQHIVRVDEDYNSTPFNPYQESLAYVQYDAIVISDYNKGFITYNNIRAIREQYSGPIFIDSKKTDLIQFEGCYVKINENEYKQTTSHCSELIVTLGEQGARYKNHVYPTQKVEVVDVCGAGDTFLAALSYYYLKNAHSIEKAISYANKCSAIAVQHRGVYSLNQSDINMVNNQND